MRSMQLVNFGDPLIATSNTNPNPIGTEIVIRIYACGVCHSDLHLWDGFFNLGDGKSIDMSRRLKLPFTLGHEIVGEIVALGPEAHGSELGDVKLVHPWVGCGRCHLCHEDLEHLCAQPRFIGTWVPGGFADHVVVPHERYLVGIGNLEPRDACVYACAGITAFSALNKVLPRASDGTLLVIGAGGLGLMAIGIARALGANKIIATDIDPTKREAALNSGANFAIDSAEDDTLTHMREICNGGPQSVIDFVGSAQSTRFGFECLGRGGSLVIVGLFGGTFKVPAPMFPLRSVNVLSSFVGSINEMRDLMTLATNGKLPTPVVQTRPLSEANEALTDLREGKVIGRTVLEP